jgi:hypothetical protein
VICECWKHIDALFREAEEMKRQGDDTEALPADACRGDEQL